MDGREQGIVKAWIEDRGMGFISSASGVDHFVHRSMLMDGQSLAVGTTVTFLPSWDQQKNKATASQVQGAVQGAVQGFQGQAAPPTISKDNLFISELPADMTEERLWEVFGQYGQITNVKLMPDIGYPTRVALIRFADASQAEWIFLNLNGNIPSGMQNPIGVKFHESKAAKGGSYGPAAMKGAGSWSPYGDGKGWSGEGKGWSPTAMQPVMAPLAPVKKDRLRIVGLPPGTNHQSVREIIGQYGIVKHVFMKEDGAALVHMEEEETAQWLVDTLNGNIPSGLETVISVAFEEGASPQVSSPGSAPQANLTGGFVTGTVKIWMQERGMGFISPDGGGEDHFVHQTNLIDGLGLVVGSPVTFMQEWDYQKNKPTAKHVSGAVGGEGVGKGAGKFAEAKGKMGLC